MRLGLQKTSLVDYPGHVSTVLFTFGCNFRCPYCQNPDLVLPGPDWVDDLLPLDTVLAFLETRKGLSSAVVISGGEPTLHADLPEIIASIRSMGFLVKVDSNGSAPEKIARCGADYLALDIKTAPGRYAELWPLAPPDVADRIVQSVRQVRGSGSLFEFRITCAPGFVDENTAETIAGFLEPDDPVFLQRYRPGYILEPSWAALVSPYTDSYMELLLAVIRKAAPLARIRGW